MTLTIQSHRGDHSCEVLDHVLAGKVFDKLTGASGEPLQERDLDALPASFRVVKALTQGGCLSYYPVTGNAVGARNRGNRPNRR